MTTAATTAMGSPGDGTAELGRFAHDDMIPVADEDVSVVRADLDSLIADANMF